MTVTDQVIAQAQQLAGDSQDSELLNLLCRAAVSSLAAQLREGFTPESCRENPEKETIDTSALEYDRVCRNPKCISQTEQELPQLFRCTDKAADIHRCVYCEQRG